MPEPVKPEVKDEVTVVQEAMINDILEDYAPPTAPSTTPKEEVSSNVKEGEERKEETPSEQVPAAASKPEEAPKEVVPPVQPASKTPPVETPPAEAPPATPPVAPPVAPVTPPVEEDEVTRLRRELVEMRAMMAEQVSKAAAPPPPPPQTPEQQKAAKENAAKQILKFLADDTAYDEVTKNAENFNVLLTAVVNTAVERALRMVPQVATSLVENQFTLKTHVEEFFRVQEDLLPYRKYVGFVTSEVAAEHPDWTLDKVLDETGKRSRERLKLPAPAPRENTPAASVQPGRRTPASQPAFVPSGPGSRRGSVQTETPTGQEKQIIDILS